MAKGVEVLSIESLHNLGSAFGRFGGQVDEISDAIIPEFQRRINAIEERRYEAAQEIRYWQQCYNDTQDEDDIRHARHMLENVQLKLREIERWQGRIDVSFQAFRGASARLRQLARDHTGNAKAFLSRKVAELQTYRAAGPSVNISVTKKNHASPGKAPEGLPPNAIEALPLTDFPLPEGFCWIKLEEIDHGRLIKEKKFYEGSYEEFQRRLDLLKNEVLPILKKNPHSNYDDFHKLDEQRGTLHSNDGLVHAESLNRTYELFFGNEPVVLDRNRGASLFGVTNGRGRIRVAKDMGWSAVPARVFESDGKRETNSKRRK